MSHGSVPHGGLEGFAVLVTGGGSGIGLGCARRFVADGASVTICGRTEERLLAASASLRADAAAGASVQHVVADVTEEDAVAAAVALAARPTGMLDGVVACAGGSETVGPLVTMDTEAWRRTLDLNITGTMLTIKHAGRLMARAAHGSIVGISSIASSNIHRWFGPYGVGKAGIDHVCMLAADELGASGVRVNAIRPGLVDTELVGFVTAGGEVLDDYLACMPISRVGTVDDVAAMARFLVGPESTWVTGQCIGVDGGHHLRRGPDYRSVLEPAFGADALRGLVD
ncbi:MAG: SDR family oxidoreductase [Actinobacteria bacterium]|nr:SDR family oxidoreductase [Actinomycetota bacterium]